MRVESFTSFVDGDTYVNAKDYPRLVYDHHIHHVTPQFSLRCDARVGPSSRDQHRTCRTGQ